MTSIDAKLWGDLLVACVDVIGRTGATAYEVGHTDDEATKWWAAAIYRGVKVFAEDGDPLAATVGLVGKLIDGGQCVRCGKTIAMRPTEGKCAWAIRRATMRWDGECHGPLNFMPRATA